MDVNGADAALRFALTLPMSTLKAQSGTHRACCCAARATRLRCLTGANCPDILLDYGCQKVWRGIGR